MSWPLALLGRHRRALLISALIAALVFFIRADAVQDERDAQAQRELETLERINDAISEPLTPADFRQRLCVHGGERTRHLCGP